MTQKTGALCEVCFSRYDFHNLTTTQQHYIEINYIKPYPDWSRNMELKKPHLFTPLCKVQGTAEIHDDLATPL